MKKIPPTTPQICAFRLCLLYILKESTVAKNATVQIEAGREVKREIEFYNLDAILSVGYRVNSKQGTQFRIWANKILKDYLLKGYAINNRMNRIEDNMEALKNKVNAIDLQINTHLIPTQGVFFDGQVFDAYTFVSDLVRSAKESIVLVDNYVDDSVLTLFSKKNSNVQCNILTKNISKQLQLDADKSNAQYPTLHIKSFDKAHDRFLIIDNSDVYHLGASLKDLGKKWFAFSKMDKDSVTIVCIVILFNLIKKIIVKTFVWLKIVIQLISGRMKLFIILCTDLICAFNLQKNKHKVTKTQIVIVFKTCIPIPSLLFHFLGFPILCLRVFVFFFDKTQFIPVDSIIYQTKKGLIQFESTPFFCRILFFKKHLIDCFFETILGHCPLCHLRCSIHGAEQDGWDAANAKGAGQFGFCLGVNFIDVNLTVVLFCQIL